MTDRNDIILKADDLYYSYNDDGQYALSGLSLEIKRGQKVACMGANGSGKSTFFLCCNGIHRPSKGTLYFDGKPADYSKKGLLALRSKVGIVFQDPDSQLFSASVFQEISFGVMNLEMPEEQVRDEVEKVIGELEISPFRNMPVHTLSGGQKKQVSIADILVMHPDIIILDEPQAALDPKHTTIVNSIVGRLTSEGITVMMATHDVDYALSWADSVILFDEGKVLMQGTPSEVFSDERALRKTNLTKPAVMQIFERLCQKGVLKTSMKQPVNLAELVSDIESIHGNRDIPAASFESGGQPSRKGILVVSFGTTHNETRCKTIDAIEHDIDDAYPDAAVYRAWTSGMIMSRLQKRDGTAIMNVSQAMERMADDGITDVIVQPTHILNGEENERMQNDARSFGSRFRSVRFGAPLLSSKEDCDEVIRIIREEYKALGPDHALVLMGHGTAHYANSMYAALDYQFKDHGCPNIFVGTVEAYPYMDTLMKLIRQSAPRRITLIPFMIVAGEHASHDMAGDDAASWYSQFRSAGFETDFIMKGLGEYPQIRSIFVRHIAETEEEA
mgnify:CR=1 FL=1